MTGRAVCTSSSQMNDIPLEAEILLHPRGTALTLECDDRNMGAAEALAA